MREEGAGNIIAALGRMEGPNATGVVAPPILVMGQSLEPAAVLNCSSRWLVPPWLALAQAKGREMHLSLCCVPG